MNAENSKDLKSKQLPTVKFMIDSGPQGLTAGFNPEGPIAGLDIIGLLGAGMWAMAVCIANEIDIPPKDVWDMTKMTVNMIQEELPELERMEGGENEVRNE